MVDGVVVEVWAIVDVDGVWLSPSNHVPVWTHAHYSRARVSI